HGPDSPAAAQPPDLPGSELCDLLVLSAQARLPGSLAFSLLNTALHSHDRREALTDHRHAHDHADEDHDHGHGPHRHGHGHSHGLVDRSILRSRAGIRAVSISLAVLTVTALIQSYMYARTLSVALLAD